MGKKLRKLSILSEESQLPGTTGTASASSSPGKTDSQVENIGTDLEDKNLKNLKKIAQELAEDAKDEKQAMKDLIIEARRRVQKAEEMIGADFEGLNLKMLRNIAQESGVSEEQCNKAEDAKDDKQAMKDLIIEARRRVQKAEDFFKKLEKAMELQPSKTTGTASASSSPGKTAALAVLNSPLDGLSDREENESIQIIKAKTMFEMVDDVAIGNNPCKVLLLSNGQAKELALSRSFDKLLTALEIKEYSCVINLLESGGFEECLTKWNGPAKQETHKFNGEIEIVCGDDGIVQEVNSKKPEVTKVIKVGHMIINVGTNPFTNENLRSAESSGFDYEVTVRPETKLQGRDKLMAGLVPNRPAFVSQTEERKAVEKIDIFMEKVIVPLAIETNAIVITRAIRGESILSESFTRVYRILRSKFSEKEPFHVISIVDQIIPLYAHPDFISNKGGLHWMKVQNGSKTWQARQRKILHVAKEYWKDKGNNKRFWDFDPYATCYVIGEGIDYGSKGCLNDAEVCSQPFNRFMTAFNTYLSYKVPSLALATGFTEKRKLNEDLDKSLAYPLNLSQSGSKVLLLDVRKRGEISMSDLSKVPARVSGRCSWHPGTGTDVWPLLELAKEKYNSTCDELLEQGLAECFDICTLAYFKSMLGNSQKEGVGCFGWKKNSNKHTQAFRFKPGKMGITYDDHGFVESTSRGGQARVSGIAKGDQIMKINRENAAAEKFSRDAVVKAEESEASYEVIVKVRLCMKPLHEALAQGLQSKKDRAIVLKNASDESDEEHIGNKANILADLRADLGDMTGSLAAWIANRTFKDAFEVLPIREKKKHIENAKRKHNALNRDIRSSRAIGSDTHTVKNLSDASSMHQTQTDIEVYRPHEILFKERIFAMETWARSILDSDKIAVANLYDFDETKQLVNSLVCKGRLPTENSFEGLQLIHQAWIDHDIAIHLAFYYKTMSKILFTLQLTFAWMVMFISSTFPGEADVLFTLTAFCGILVPIESIFSSNARWRHMRSSAGELQSMIWCYRTRVGDFEIDPASARRPDLVFKEALNAWRDELVSGANLDKSTLAKPYGDRIFQHQQKRGRPIMKKFKDITGKLKQEEECDDNYSPQGPYEYIEKRLLPAIDFYQKRIPGYGYQCIGTRIVLLVCAVAASFLTKYGLITYVGAVTAFGSAITTWSEYTDAERKLSRYTRVVRDLQRQLNWWRSLTDLEEAGSENIRLLVTATEEIISQERLGWAARKRLLNTDPASQQQFDGQGLNDDSK